MNKHTPGPWDYGWQIQPNGCPTVGHKGLMVCMVAHSAKDPEQKETALANANLIAAAPDLLEALEGLLDNEKQSSFEFWQSNNHPSGDCDSVHSQWLESSEYADFLDLYGDEIAAIAKARGEA